MDFSLDFHNYARTAYSTEVSWLSDGSDESDVSGDDELSQEETVESSSDSEDTEIPDTNDLASHDTLLHSDKLTESEKQIIDKCDDSEMKRLLLLNRQKHLKLIQIYRKTYDLIKDIDTSIQEKRQKFEAMRKEEMKKMRAPCYRLGAPYFKDSRFFRSPANSDFSVRKESNELSVYECRTSFTNWLLLDCDNLKRGVRLSYLKNYKLKVQIKKEKSDEKHNELIRKLEECTDEDELPLLNYDEYVNWFYVSDIFLNGKFSWKECQRFWDLYLDPKINKSEWTLEENDKLLELVEKYNYQDWDTIAKELNTNRSGFITCVHFYSKLFKKIKKTKFTPEEDKELLEVIEKCRQGDDSIPWTQIEAQFPNRDKHQIYHRYKYYLKRNMEKRTGKFSDAEDILLLILVDRFGKNFAKCAEHMPRSLMQIKNRYNTHLQETSLHVGPFTSDEDEAIMDFVEKHGTSKWNELSKILSRSRVALRQRYITIKRTLNSKPKASVKGVITRTAANSKTPAYYKFIRMMADQYKNSATIPTLETIELALGPQCVDDNNKNIDDLLVECFDNSVKLKHNKELRSVDIMEGVTNVETVLTCLGSRNLDIPGNYRDDPNLDVVDKVILGGIANKQFEGNDELLPPSLHTLVGLRSLLIKHRSFKKLRKDDNINTFLTEKSNLIVEKNDVEEILNQRNTFQNRVDKLFQWSSISSLEKPTIADNSAEFGCTLKPPQKSYTRKAKKTPSKTPNVGGKKSKNEKEPEVQVEESVLPEDEDNDLEDLRKLELALGSSNIDIGPACSYKQDFDDVKMLDEVLRKCNNDCVD